jgi:alpha-glucosidase (family GH31 glycosyl hydrolase)
LPVAAGEALRVDLAIGGHWYGHGFNHVQPYPLETGRIVNERFAVNNIQCPVWMASAGLVLMADTAEQLDVRLNADGDGALTVTAPAAWQLRVFIAPTLPEAHRQFLDHIAWPPPAPPLAPGDSFFCTWTQFPRCLTRERILGMARDIRARDYPCTTLIIDDRWESCFGELTFGRDIPDPAGLVRELHALGFRVWLWVTPFVNREAATFDDLSARHILVPRRDGNGAALLKWWGGTAGLVDLTAPVGRTWYREQLLRLKREYGVDGFKIDGGDAKYHPPLAEAAWHDYPGASGYSDLLLALFEEVAPHACETRTAWRSQHRRILWREGGKDSHWGLDNGLAALVTLGLHSSLLGYDVLIPDMVPGRVQTMNTADPLPTDELMVRWTEVSALFPLVQFSYLPWNYAAPTAEAVHGWAAVHQALGPYLTAQWADRRKPLLRPLWYDDPANAALYTVADEFLLGADVLVAPVLTAGMTGRDVLLPAGTWVDAWTGATLSAGRHAHYPAPCPGMPLFVRASRPDVLAALQPALGRIARGTVASSVTTATYVAGLNRDLNVTG